MVKNISIVIPLFNNGEFLEKTLESVISQTHDDFECILIDDGCTDNSMEIVNSVLSSANFRVIKRPDSRFKGANACRNIGIEIAQSDYILFLDADDLLYKDCLKNRLQKINEFPENDLWMFSTAVFEANKMIGFFPQDEKTNDKFLFDLITHHIPWQTTSVLWKRDFLLKIGGWNENYSRLQDIELNIRALLNNPRIQFVFGMADSFYRYMPMSSVKQQNALISYTFLIRDYYNVVHDQLRSSNKTLLKEKIERIIDYQFLEHLNLYKKKKSTEWILPFLDVLNIVKPQKVESYKKIIKTLETI